MGYRKGEEAGEGDAYGIGRSTGSEEYHFPRYFASIPAIKDYRSNTQEQKREVFRRTELAIICLYSIDGTRRKYSQVGR